MTETSQEVSGDLVQLIGARKVICKKVCGSIGCKRDIRIQQCIGIIPDRCLSLHAKSEQDRIQATKWINGKDADVTWLLKPDSRTHQYTSTISDIPARITTSAPSDPDTSHLSDVAYFRNFGMSAGFIKS